LEATGGDYAWAFIIAAIISVAGLALVIAYLLARLRLPAKSAVEASSHRVDSADKVGTSEA